MTLDFRTQCLLSLVGLCLLLAGSGPLFAQGVDITGRPIAEIRIEGNQQVSTQLIRNQLTLEPGDPYDPEQVATDIQNLTRLGRFATVEARTEQNEDGSVDLIYSVAEQDLLAEVQIVGNKAFADQELKNQIVLGPGDPNDPFLIQQAQDQIRAYYRDEGYFLADVEVDRETLQETGILILRVREGPRIKVRDVEFQGNAAFTDDQLQSEIKTNTYIFIFRKGVLSREQLERDIGRIRDFYKNRGYLDVRVGRRVSLSPDQEDATVTFLIDEGQQYTVSSIEINGNEAFPDRQIRQAIPLKVGDVYSRQRRQDARETLEDLYGKQGMIETQVQIQRVFDTDEPTVSLTINIEESRRYTVGNLIIRGNRLTQEKVIRRQIRGLIPGRAFDETGVDTTERRIRETDLFGEAKVTVQQEQEEPVRDVLIEVEEKNTGSLSFGAAVSSDSGVFGAIDLTQKNFDATDVPESWGEFFTGRAFRGAGQYFSITLQPGNEFQRYQVNFREPYMLGTDYFLDTNAFFFTRRRDNYDEQRIGGVVGLGKRFGDVWSASVRGRFEEVTIDDLDTDATVDAAAVEGDNTVQGLGFNITRSTVDSRIFPTEGTRFKAGIEQVGLLGGDFDFTRLNAEWNGFLTVEEDFFGRKTVLSLRSQVGYIPQENEAPLFERFYAGGHRTFRGFDFRGVGPRGIIASGPRAGEVSEDPVGGDFIFLLGPQYNFPIWQDILRGVFFVDSGTVQDDIGLDKYRVSVGGGIRLKLPFFGQAPFAFDLAWPIVKEETDETRIFSFDLALPF